MACIGPEQRANSLLLLYLQHQRHSKQTKATTKNRTQRNNENNSKNYILVCPNLHFYQGAEGCITYFPKFAALSWLSANTKSFKA
jgi:hypothetical protein